MELDEIQLLAIKAESTYDVDPTPAVTADLIPCTNLRWEPASTRISPKPLRHGHARTSGHNSRKHVVLRFDYQLRGNGTIQAGAIGQKVEIDPLLLAADLAATYTAESTPAAGDGFVTYAPTVPVTDGASVTAYWWTQGKLHKLTGGKVNIERVRYTADQFAIVTFAIMGRWLAPADTTFPSATANFLVSTKPPIFAGGTITYNGSTALVIENAEWTLGNEIVPRFGANSTDGIKGFRIVDRLVAGSFDPEAELVATQDFWGQFAASTNFAASISLGSTAGNRVAVTIGDIEIIGAPYGARNKMRTHQIQFEACRDSVASGPNAEFSLKFS